MAIELLGLGKDITRVRKQISVFMQVLSTEEGKKDITDKIIAIIKGNASLYEKFKPYTLEKNYPYLLNLSGRLIKNLLSPLGNLLVKSQYTVNPYTAYIFEFLFALENEKDETIASESKAILAKIHTSFNIQVLLLSELSKCIGIDLENEENATLSLEKWDGIMPFDDPDFDYYFALTLRQTSTERVYDFLDFQIGLWGEKERFVNFLKAVLVGQKQFIPKQNRTVAKQWIAESTTKSNPQGLTIQSLNITTEKVLINKSPNTKSSTEDGILIMEFSNEAFKQAPFEGERIKCSLSPELERRFFSFLWKEKLGTDSAFLANEEFKFHCLDYGFFVPLQKLPKRFHLNLGSKRSRNVIYHCFYQFFSQNATSGRKAIVSTFLLHTFDNFDHISVENMVHHLHDYKLSEKELKFDIGYYLGKTTIKSQNEK